MSKLLCLAGILSDEEADAIRDAVADRRYRRSKELDDIADRIREP